MPVKDDARLFRAIQFAVDAHAGQFRKGTAIPYVFHAVGVAQILAAAGCAEEVVVAGLLHDTVEDTSVTLGEIRTVFGDEVARLVEGVSEPDKSDAWENRKQHTIDGLATAPTEVLLVTCADKLDNIRAIEHDLERVGASVWSRFSRPKAQQRWYYASVAEMLGRRLADEPGASLARKLRHKVAAVFGAPQ